MFLYIFILKVSSYLYKICVLGWLGFISRVLYYIFCWIFGEGDLVCLVFGIIYFIRIDGKYGFCFG